MYSAPTHVSMHRTELKVVKNLIRKDRLERDLNRPEPYSTKNIFKTIKYEYPCENCVRELYRFEQRKVMLTFVTVSLCPSYPIICKLMIYSHVHVTVTNTLHEIFPIAKL